jgi:hypothetical protein
MSKFYTLVNDNLFHLICENNYDKHNSEKILDILNNTDYIIDYKDIDKIQRHIMSFTDNDDNIKITEKLCFKGNIDITIIHICNRFFKYNCNENLCYNTINNIFRNYCVGHGHGHGISNNEINNMLDYINSNCLNILSIIIFVNIYNYNIRNEKIEIFINKLILSNIKNIIQNYKEEIINLYRIFDCNYKYLNLIENLKLLDIIELSEDDKVRKNIKNNILQCIYPENFTHSDILNSFKYIKKNIYSEYLSKKKNKEILKEFILLTDYTDISLIKSMRILFDSIILPKESQDIIYILEIFTDHFLNCNKLEYSNTLIFQLIIAILMLNTDLHNKNVTKKISNNKFIHNWYKNVDKEMKIEKDILKKIYIEIKSNRFTINF